MRRTAPLGFACLLAACQGKVLALGDDDPPPVDVPANLAENCQPAPATARTFASREEMSGMLAGVWFRCRGVGPGILFPTAIELTDDGGSGAWFSLVDDGTGALVRATDPARRGRWVAEPPLTLHVRFENAAQQTLVVLFDERGQHFSVARSTFESVDVGYVRE